MGEQVHNSAVGIKAELRKRVVEWLGGPPAVSVFETHAGPGEMHRRVYPRVARWLGVDQDPKSPDSIHADSRLVLRALDLAPFNLFDVDAFGSPWEHVWLVSQRRRTEAGERVGVVITTGTSGGFACKLPTPSGVSSQMVDAIGLSPSAANKWLSSEKGAEPFAQRLVSAWFDGCKVERWLTASGPGKRVWYFAAMLRAA